MGRVLTVRPAADAGPTHPPSELTGRVVVVTGGVGGIGSAVAHAFAAAGARVVVGSRTAVERAASSARRVGPGVTAMNVDLRSASAVDAFLLAIDSSFGPIDILVNSAGVCYHKALSDHADDRWHETIDVNLGGVYRTMRFCLPRMIARRWGRIINIASDIALLGAAHYAAYCASKAAVISLTRSAALEGARFGVCCNTISPSWVATDMASLALRAAAEVTGQSAAECEREMLRRCPRGRFIEPDEIAGLAVYLCGDRAAGITMQDVAISGGSRWYVTAPDDPP